VLHNPLACVLAYPLAAALGPKPVAESFSGNPGLKSGTLPRSLSVNLCVDRREDGMGNNFPCYCSHAVAPFRRTGWLDAEEFRGRDLTLRAPGLASSQRRTTDMGSLRRSLLSLPLLAAFLAAAGR